MCQIGLFSTRNRKNEEKLTKPKRTNGSPRRKRHRNGQKEYLEK